MLTCLKCLRVLQTPNQLSRTGSTVSAAGLLFIFIQFITMNWQAQWCNNVAVKTFSYFASSLTGCILSLTNCALSAIFKNNMKAEKIVPIYYRGSEELINNYIYTSQYLRKCSAKLFDINVNSIVSDGYMYEYFMSWGSNKSWKAFDVPANFDFYWIVFETNLNDAWGDEPSICCWNSGISLS